MVTWHLTMKLLPAKCHERATLRKLWRQTGNSSLLPAKCWPLLHVMAGISARFSNFAFVLFCYITNRLMTGLGNSEFWFPRISMFPSRFSGNKIHCSPRNQSLSVDYHCIQLVQYVNLKLLHNTLGSRWPEANWRMGICSIFPQKFSSRRKKNGLSKAKKMASQNCTWSC